MAALGRTIIRLECADTGAWLGNFDVAAIPRDGEKVRACAKLWKVKEVIYSYPVQLHGTEATVRLCEVFQ